MKLKTTDIINPVHPNRSTALFGGVSSGILNWNDLRHPEIYKKRERLRATFYSASDFDFSQDDLTEGELNFFHLLAQMAHERLNIANAIADVASDASVTSILATMSDQLNEQVLTVKTINGELMTTNILADPIRNVEDLYSAMRDFIEGTVKYIDVKEKGAGEFLERVKQDDSLHADFFFYITPIIEEETGTVTDDSEWLRNKAKTHEVYLLEDIAEDSGNSSTGMEFHGFDDL